MIYKPSDDSYLLEKEVKKLSKNKKVIDIGTGSGIQALAAKAAGAKSVLAVDINLEAVKSAQKIGINAIQSDLFSNIPKKQKFDLIIFNPPYLPHDEREDSESALATSGGKKGDELILKFLSGSPNYLEKKGKILLLVSSLTPKKRIELLLKKLNLTKKVLSEKKIFMESLEVWILNKNSA